MDQNKTPFLDALKKYVEENNATFDVPAHHMGHADNDFKDYVGQMTYTVDVNAPRGLDNLNHPSGVLLEAENLMADCYHADEAFFLINGTSSGILAMIMASVKAHEKIIIPRNCHKSAINALIISGAIPVFVMPEFDNNLEIANQPTLENYKKAILENPDAKAIFVINPTYFGATLDLVELTKFAHEHNMIVLADEAHGSHFAFSKELPISAMDAGCDLSAASFHKTSGSLTQSSVLLRKGNRVSHYDVFKSLMVINTTSPSTLLLASLDAARKYMAVDGERKQEEIIELAEYTRNEINKIPGFKARGEEYFKENHAYGYDLTKVVIELESVSVNGFDVYRILKDKYNVQMELAEQYVVLAIFGIGSTKRDSDMLIRGLKGISRLYYISKRNYPKYHYNISFPETSMRPRVAYQAPQKKVKLEDAIGLISKESIMAYPPGIPLIIPGEVFNEAIIQRINHYKETGATVLMDYDDGTVSTVDYDQYLVNRGTYEDDRYE